MIVNIEKEDSSRSGIHSEKRSRSEMEEISTLKQRLQCYQRKVLALKHSRDSAVLIPLFERDGELSLIFTRRTGQVKHHKHQISFPGGVRESGDCTLQDTALRETEEEIGLKRSHVEIMGAIDDLHTVTGFRITPFAGLIPPEYPFVLNSVEIKELITVPASQLLEPSIFSSGFRTFQGKKYQSYFFRVNEKTVIWGATAEILAQFLEVAFHWTIPQVLLQNSPLCLRKYPDPKC